MTFGGNTLRFLEHLYISNSILCVVPGTNFERKAAGDVPRFVPRKKVLM